MRDVVVQTPIRWILPLLGAALIPLANAQLDDPELRAAQVPFIETYLMEADQDADGVLNEQEVVGLSKLLYTDPILRRDPRGEGGGVVITDQPTPVVRGYLEYDLDDDGDIVMADLPEAMQADVAGWDTNTNGILENQELITMDGIQRLHRALFTPRMRNSANLHATLQPILNDIAIDPAIKQAITQAMDDEVKRQFDNQADYRTRVMDSVKDLLGERFEDLSTHVANHLSLNQDGANGEGRLYQYAIASDADGDYQLAGDELTDLNERLIDLRIRYRPDDVSYWERNLYLVDRDGDHSIRRGELVFFEQAFFDQYDTNQDDVIDQEEIEAIEQAMVQKFYTGEIAIGIGGYSRLIPPMQDMGVSDATIERFEAMLVEQAQTLRANQEASRERFVQEIQTLMGEAGYQAFQDAFVPEQL